MQASKSVFVDAHRGGMKLRRALAFDVGGPSQRKLVFKTFVVRDIRSLGHFLTCRLSRSRLGRSLAHHLNFWCPVAPGAKKRQKRVSFLVSTAAIEKQG